MQKMTTQEQLQQLHEESFAIKIEVLYDGRLPFKAHRTDAGFDVFATDDVIIHPGEIIKHSLNIKMQLPRGTYASIESKSGLGARGLLVYAGVIDQGYRGVPHVVATNLNHKDPNPIVIKKHEKIAQFIVYPFNSEYYIKEVYKVDENTARSGGGFGSTGK